VPFSQIALIVYAAGVLIGLAVVRDRWPVRIATALVWPLGPIALLVVTVLLLSAATALWPARMISGFLILAALAWWMVGT
jgi:hypothetical protein